MTPICAQGENGVLAIKCTPREKGFYAYAVLDFPNYRLKAEILWEEGLQDDRSAEFMETMLEIKRFFWGWSGNGCLEV
jgi:hypothetical protein